MDQASTDEKFETQSPKPKLKGAFNPNIYRALVWIIVAICSLFTLGGLSTVGDPTLAEGQISVAEATKSSNDLMTEGAPQQQVVNGWFVVDALPIVSEQLSGIHQAGVYNSRMYYLGLIVTLGVAADIIGRSFGAQQNTRTKNESLFSK